jgi:hypothetical protein
VFAGLPPIRTNEAGPGLVGGGGECGITPLNLLDAISDPMEIRRSKDLLSESHADLQGGAVHVYVVIGRGVEDIRRGTLI